MENEVVETVSIWKKKQGDLTVSDQLKVVGAASVIGIVAPIAIGAITYGGIVLTEKIQNRWKAHKVNKWMKNRDEDIRNQKEKENES